jgi:hypothetical protein
VAADDDLRLNSLDRFAKTSPRFILEEHSHCEVPAGCGGVVLRWIDPAAGLPVLLDVFHAATATLAIDGAVVTTSRVLLAPGRHVLSLEFPALPDARRGLFILAGRLTIQNERYASRVLVRSIGDGSWLFVTGAAPAGWTTAPELPAPGPRVAALVARRLAKPQERGHGRYLFERACEHGGNPIGVPPGTGRGPIHVRTVFAVPVVTA